MREESTSERRASDRTAKVLLEVLDERRRQEQLFLDGKLGWNCSHVDVDLSLKHLALAEEFGEVAKEACLCVEGLGDGGRLRAELLQVAAVAVAWAESILQVREEEG